MTPHNTAEKGQIASTCLMPGDPLRAKMIAENFLTDVECFNQTRGMLGYTGNYQGKRVSVMGHGMGIPSIGLWDIFKNKAVNGVLNGSNLRYSGCTQPHFPIRRLLCQKIGPPEGRPQSVKKVEVQETLLPLNRRVGLLP